MSMQLIRTQSGLTTDWQAFDKLKEPGYSPALQISILTQLQDINPILAHEGAAWIKANSSEKDNLKVVRVAKEILTGLPLGIKYLGKIEQYEDFFRRVPAGSQVMITFKEDRIDDIARLLHGSRRSLSFDHKEAVMFLSCVVQSGRWESISKTFHAQVADLREVDIGILALNMRSCVESVELLYTLEQLAAITTGVDSPMKKKLNVLMEKYTDVDYDKDLFLEAINGLDYPQARAWVEEFALNEPLQNVIGRFLSDYGKLEFFKAYALKYQLLLAE